MKVLLTDKRKETTKCNSSFDCRKILSDEMKLKELFKMYISMGFSENNDYMDISQYEPKKMNLYIVRYRSVKGSFESDALTFEEARRHVLSFVGSAHPRVNKTKVIEKVLDWTSTVTVIVIFISSLMIVVAEYTGHEYFVEPYSRYILFVLLLMLAVSIIKTIYSKADAEKPYCTRDKTPVRYYLTLLYKVLVFIILMYVAILIIAKV